MSKGFTVPAPDARDAKDRLQRRFGYRTGDDIRRAFDEGRSFDRQSIEDIAAAFGRHKRVARPLSTLRSAN